MSEEKFQAKQTNGLRERERERERVKIRVETRRALTCDDQTVGSVAHACTDTRGDNGANHHLAEKA